jgi:hypothetical protein
MSVNMTLITPDPLNSYLFAYLNETFGRYPEVVQPLEATSFPLTPMS